jgi:hypothetical protein
MLHTREIRHLAPGVVFDLAWVRDRSAMVIGYSIAPNAPGWEEFGPEGSRVKHPAFKDMVSFKRFILLDSFLVDDEISDVCGVRATVRYTPGPREYYLPYKITQTFDWITPMRNLHIPPEKMHNLFPGKDANAFSGNLRDPHAVTVQPGVTAVFEVGLITKITRENMEKLEPVTIPEPPVKKRAKCDCQIL